MDYFDFSDEDDEDFEMELPDFGFTQETLDYHGLNVGDIVNYEYDLTEEGFEIKVGSQSRKRSEIENPADYSMPNAFIEYFSGAMYQSNALSVLSRAINTPYEACLSTPSQPEKTPEENLVNTVETKLAETIGATVEVLVNPTVSAVSRFSRYNTELSVIYTCSPQVYKEMGDLKTVTNIIPRHRVSNVKWSDLCKVVGSRMVFFGYNYRGLIDSKLRGYALKVNLANSMVYGLNVIDYNMIQDPPESSESWLLAIPHSQLDPPDSTIAKPSPVYQVTARRKKELKDSMWCDQMLPYMSYDMTTILPHKLPASKNYKLNCFSVVTSEFVNKSSVQVDYPMYSPVGYGYPTKYKQDHIVFSDGPLKGTTGFIGRFSDVEGTLRLVDVVTPALSWETRVEILRRYGYLYGHAKQGWIKVNPRFSATQLYNSDVTNSLLIRGKSVSVADTEDADLVLPFGSFKYDAEGKFISFHSASGFQAANQDLKVLIIHKEGGYYHRESSSIAFEHVGAIKFYDSSDKYQAHIAVAKRFISSSHFVQGRTISSGTPAPDKYVLYGTHGENVRILTFSPPTPCDSTSLVIPNGLMTNRFTPYNKYDLELAGYSTV